MNMVVLREILLYSILKLSMDHSFTLSLKKRSGKDVYSVLNKIDHKYSYLYFRIVCMHNGASAKLFLELLH